MPASPSRSATTPPIRRSSGPTTALHTRQGAWGGQAAAAKSKSRCRGASSASARYPTDCQTRGEVAEDSDGATVGTAEGETGRGRPPRPLLLAKHGVLHRLGETELAHALGRNLDGLAGLRIAPHARL